MQFNFGDFMGGMGGMGGMNMGGPRRKNETKFYDLVGASRDDSCAAIKKKFKKVAQKAHPDKGGDPAKFAEISAAADVLCDPEKRKVYDQYGEEGINKGMTGESGFGGAPSNHHEEPEQCPSVSFNLQVSLEEVFTGKTSKVAINRTRICNTCFGLGGSRSITCNRCNGQGSVTTQSRMGPFSMPQTMKCPQCYGKGERADPQYVCAVCRGSRHIKEKKVIEVAIQPGVVAGHQYSFPKESDEEVGKTPGDLNVTIQIKDHPVYTRKGNDLLMNRNLTLVQGLTGFKFPHQHIDGRMHLMSTKPGEITAPLETKMYAGMGLPTSANQDSFGHLFITFQVEFPRTLELSQEQRNSLKSMLPSRQGEIIDMSDFDNSTIHHSVGTNRK